ncbi:hypothetical protein CAPTEDRAFT_201873 [Capitella teleta]|uniref:Uncharacterized protein n=1 Tax=Capitella teleta TaxID=283909 RepID=R7VKR5_CAPTE|nr:hypothetical protein CAPTEDRAFT_201873 [Capitella teleta]|eukprot:ELU16990.1 hypothetical protein CAPTEDRAFT_201873 [Capitella teleta]
MADASDTLRDLNGRVNLQNSMQLTDDLTLVRSVSLIVLNLNPVSVQIWRHSNNSDLAFTLTWKRDLFGFEYIGRHVIDLESDEIFVMTPQDRLGIFNIREPGPIDTEMTSSATSVLSTHRFSEYGPALNHSYKFDHLDFPVRYLVKLCSSRGCVEGTDDEKAASNASEKQDEGSDPDAAFWTSDWMQSIFFVWLLVVSGLIIIAFILLAFLFHKIQNRSSEVTNEVSLLSTNGGVPNEGCYLVMGDNSNQEWMKNVVGVLENRLLK